jgi:methyl-accepting chemotaxis protein
MSGTVNPDFIPACENSAIHYPDKSDLMAFGLFRKRLQGSAAPAVTRVAPPAAEASAASEGDSAREILELLELELGAMIRQLERAAQSVAGGADATAVRSRPSASARTR